MAAEVDIDQVQVKKVKRSMGKILLLAINVILFLSGAAFFVLTKLGILNTSFIHSEIPSSSAVAQGKSVTPSPGEFPEQELVDVRMRPFVINLSGDRGRRFLRLVLQLAVKGERARITMDDHQAPVRDHLIVLLSSKTFDDISSAQGKYQLREEILKAINDVIGTPLVAKIYFTEFIVQ